MSTVFVLELDTLQKPAPRSSSSRPDLIVSILTKPCHGLELEPHRQLAQKRDCLLLGRLLNDQDAGPLLILNGRRYIQSSISLFSSVRIECEELEHFFLMCNQLLRSNLS